jgi:hypothetical protein
MNFAKNNICLQCDAKRPKRQLLPGEWECPRLAHSPVLVPIFIAYSILTV